MAAELIHELNRNESEFDSPALDVYASMYTLSYLFFEKCGKLIILCSYLRSFAAFVDIKDIENEVFNALFIAGIYHSACIYLFRVIEPVPALSTLPPLAKTPYQSALRILYMAMYTSKIR